MRKGHSAARCVSSHLESQHSGERDKIAKMFRLAWTTQTNAVPKQLKVVYTAARGHVGVSSHWCGQGGHADESDMCCYFRPGWCLWSQLFLRDLFRSMVLLLLWPMFLVHALTGNRWMPTIRAPTDFEKSTIAGVWMTGDSQ